MCAAATSVQQCRKLMRWRPSLHSLRARCQTGPVPTCAHQFAPAHPPLFHQNGLKKDLTNLIELRYSTLTKSTLSLRNHTLDSQLEKLISKQISLAVTQINYRH